MAKTSFFYSFWFIDLFDKIVLKSDLFLVGRRTVTAFNEPTVNNNIVLNESDEIEFINSTEDGLFVFNLKPFLDMNISAEYRYNKKISGFIQFNNFTAKIPHWTTFQSTYKCLGGVTLVFKMLKSI